MTQTLHEKVHQNNGEKKNDNADLTFVYVEHGPEDFDQIFQQVAAMNPDIIALEQAGGTEESKNSLANIVSDAVASLPKNAHAIDKFSHDPMVKAILKHLSKSDVKFEFIDVTLADIGYELALLSQDSLKKIMKSINFNDDTETKNELENYLELDSRSARRREYLMANQIRRITEDYPGKKVVAIMGASHTAVSHQLKDLSTKRTFITGQQIQGQVVKGEKMRYPALDRVSRAKRFGKEITDEHMDETIRYLSDYMAKLVLARNEQDKKR